jgi:hypothetical protein
VDIVALLFWVVHESAGTAPMELDIDETECARSEPNTDATDHSLSLS